jgi:hypothetical protein
MIYPDDRENVRQAVKDAIDGRAAYDLVHRILLPDGSEKYMHEHWCPVKSNGNWKNPSTGKALRLIFLVSI